ncbi:MAG: DAK2 domain-containing protein [Candidatus Phytoplasma asteris]|uniref:Predicted kinase related to dihydroxyacetone kinase n=1 Tax='Chrysanthemum coronarium' phytoplasma TaxID=1520703 RepID=A0ABQ0J455_9MOLU|nr:DAK2 domain-containing protein ['Chrysanthemum coronarium' phytoplasma]TKA88021.1 MAG: dihydroxyacetone/glyceraldehyde kinase [Periwinkle leaf yellowing phytoplasma]WEX19518.1 MAG: DAK2 domain-containing protein [Candidatus Phytoplasma asteris]GAK73993.1 predicted kinase related to dihydroxyacetone kinase ['Chrysanthemum coronarium' phytoplasma]
MNKDKVIQFIDGQLFKNMITNGAINLQNNYQTIDNLNVFPVPDRDTGTNMKITMMSGVKEISNLETRSIVEVSQVLSKALLMGAKGNSGVILSQFFAGMAQTYQKLNKETININDFIHSLEGGYQKAYQAIIEPQEGTILTVFREAVKQTLKAKSQFSTIEDVLSNFLQNAQKTLSQTTELLEVLKQAGVVDSGGAGFVEILKGMLLFLQDQKLLQVNQNTQTQTNPDKIQTLGQVNIKYTYCTEYIFQIKASQEKNLDMKQLKQALLQIGDSLVLVKDQEILKIHIHTNKPGQVLEKLLTYGTLKVSKIDNMKEQHQSILDKKHDTFTLQQEPTPDPKSPSNLPNSNKDQKYIFIAFVNDTKSQKVFADLKVNHIIKQSTFNPTTFEKLLQTNTSQNIIILPNDTSLLEKLTTQLKQLQGTNQEIVLLQTKNIAQGYSALLAFDKSLDLVQNKTIMEETIKNIQTGKIIYADKKDAKNISNQNLLEKEYLSVWEEKIIATNKDKYQALKTLLQKMIKPHQTFLTVFYNPSCTDEKELEKLETFLETNYDHIELETLESQNNNMPYIVSLE